MEDEKIIDLYWARDEAAIRETDIKYHPYCGAIAIRILEDREDAEECVNDTWLHTWNAIPPERPGILSAFLGRITRNLSIDRYRARHAARRRTNMETVDLELADLEGRYHLDEQVEDRVIAATISDFLRRTDQFSRILFVRRYWYMESIRDIAERYEVSESKVKSNLFRTRKALRQHLLEEGVSIA